jgi:hypothetical protein
MLAGGGCAILLQLAHPSVGRGVAEHSDFASRPYDRLIGTLTYVTAVACGTEDDIRAVHRAVGRAHAPVHGAADSETPAYSAFDPDLQLWVTATLYWTAVRVHERVFGPLDQASADRFYREFAAVGTSLQLPPEAWPASRVAKMVPKIATPNAPPTSDVHSESNRLFFSAAMSVAELKVVLKLSKVNWPASVVSAPWTTMYSGSPRKIRT